MLMTRDVRGLEQPKRLERLLRKTEEGTYERAWLQWQLTLALISQNKDKKAAKLLKNLMKADNNPVGQDLMNMTVARILYQNGYLDEATNYYSKVPKSSEYWFEAQEESAWAFRAAAPASQLCTWPERSCLPWAARRSGQPSGQSHPLSSPRISSFSLATGRCRGSPSM